MVSRRLAVGAVLVMLRATPSAASPCIEADILEVFAHTPVVFVGEVMTSEPVTYEGHPASQDQAFRAAYTIRVLEELKGTGAQDYRLLGDAPLPSPPPGSGIIVVCEDNRPLEVGKRYLVFATDNPLTIDSCASVALRDAASTLTKLRAVRQKSDRGASRGPRRVEPTSGSGQDGTARRSPRRSQDLRRRCERAGPSLVLDRRGGGAYGVNRRRK